MQQITAIAYLIVNFDMPDTMAITSIGKNSQYLFIAMVSV